MSLHILRNSWLGKAEMCHSTSRKCDAPQHFPAFDILEYVWQRGSSAASQPHKQHVNTTANLTAASKSNSCSLECSELQTDLHCTVFIRLASLSDSGHGSSIICWIYTSHCNRVWRKVSVAAATPGKVSCMLSLSPTGFVAPDKCRWLS